MKEAEMLYKDYKKDYADGKTESDVLVKLLKDLRYSHGYTMKALAEKIGMSAQNYSQYEHYKRCPKAVTLKKISRAYGMGDNYIVMEVARQMSDTAEFGTTNDAVFDQIPDSLRGELTAKQLAVVSNAINRAYHKGKQDAGAELIDDNCVYLNKAGKMIEWDSDFKNLRLTK